MRIPRTHDTLFLDLTENTDDESPAKGNNISDPNFKTGRLITDTDLHSMDPDMPLLYQMGSVVVEQLDRTRPKKLRAIWRLE